MGSKSFDHGDYNMRENMYQRNLKQIIREILPGCFILKNDPEHLQGFPDLLILYGNKWAALEVKRSATASKQPNQDYYIHKLGEMSYASFIYPENEKEVLHELFEALRD